MRTIYIFCAMLLSFLCVSCTPPQNESKMATYLKVLPSEVVFNADTENFFVIDTDGEWIITSSESITLSAKSGDKGEHKINIIALTGSSTQTVVVRTPSNPALAGIVRIIPSKKDDNNTEPTPTPTPTPTTTLYYDNLDGNTSYKGWADNNTSWQNPTGEGVGDINYASRSAYVRNDNYGSSNKYTGASGGGYIRISEPSGDIRYLEIHNIATNGEKDLTFSFGAAFKESQCSIYISCDNSAWKKLEYTASSSYNSWALAKASFSIVGYAEKLSFRIEPIDINVNYGYNIDDLRLETSSGGQTIESTIKTNYRWAELPEKSNSKSDYIYNTHWSRSVTSNKNIRNYSYCYDVRRHSPMWIAHPQHAIYEEGGKTRPASDPWARDPYLTDAQSAIIYPIDGRTCSLRTYEDETYQTFYQWGRGHMLASSYRGCGNSSNPAEINVQTFYSSNVAAQRSGNSAFQKLWGDAEKRIQDNYICSDTLYVVSGAHFANENTTALDANIFYLPDYCKSCVVPTHFYKIVLRTKKGNSGKAIQECTASELKAVGFWFSNTDIDEQTGSASPALSSAHMRSIAEIERLTGNEFNFFPDIPNEVKQSFNASDWGF